MDRDVERCREVWRGVERCREVWIEMWRGVERCGERCREVWREPSASPDVPEVPGGLGLLSGPLYRADTR